jgi:CHAD domain-containing protein
MAYRIGVRESAPRAVRRIAREQVDRAIAGLTDSKADPDDAIHSARRRFKKVRSLLRIARESMGEAFEQENAWYRDHGRELAALRDATMLIETLDGLDPGRSKSGRPSRWPSVRKRLVERRKRIAAGGGDMRDAMRALSRRLAPARRRIAAWPLDGMDDDALARALRKTYARGRRALRRVLKDPGEEAFHELRKRIKDLWHQSRLLRELWPDGAGERCEELNAAAESLGRANDLAILHRAAKDLAADAAVAKQCAGLVRRIIERREALLRDGLMLAAAIYSEKPKAIAARSKAHWRGGGRDGD